MAGWRRGKATEKLLVFMVDALLQLLAVDTPLYTVVSSTDLRVDEENRRQCSGAARTLQVM